jgi:hypothetical protein
VFLAARESEMLIHTESTVLSCVCSSIVSSFTNSQIYNITARKNTETVEPTATEEAAADNFI